MFNKLSIISFWLYLMPLGIVCATAVVFFQNTLYLAFNFIIILAISAAIVFCLRAEFLAYTILIVYIGAIAILFLFVIMMLNLKININTFNKIFIFSTWEICILFFLVLKTTLLSKLILIPKLVEFLGQGIIWSDFWEETNFKKISNVDVSLVKNWSTTNIIEILGDLIYIKFFYLLIMIGIVLLVAMVGALILTTTKSLLIKCESY